MAGSLWRFLESVFGHWQTWLSGTGVGGSVVIVVHIAERLLGKELSKRQYALLFIVSFFLACCFLSWVDKDIETKSLANANSLQKATDMSLLAETQNELGAVRFDCQYKSGVVDTLQRQNRDQQGTINNCQTQAIKLLAPVPLLIRAVVSELGEYQSGTLTAVIVDTNKPLNPVVLDVRCNDDFELVRISTPHEGPGTFIATLPRADARSYPLRMSSPAWLPGKFWLLLVTHKRNVAFNCQVQEPK